MNKKITLIDFGESIVLSDTTTLDKLLKLPLNIDHLYLILSYTFYLEIKSKFCCNEGNNICTLFNEFKDTESFINQETALNYITTWFNQFYWLFYISLVFLKKITRVYNSVNKVYDEIITCYEIIWQGYDHMLNDKLFVHIRADSMIKNKKIIESNCADTVNNYLDKYWTTTGSLTDQV